jgi:ankyrin repeat protein
MPLRLVLADANTWNKYHSSALHAAALRGHVEACIALVELGAVVNALDDGGCTPVLLAADGGYADVVRALYGVGADVQKVADCGATPMYCAGTW